MTRCYDATCLDGPREDDDQPLPRYTDDPHLLCRRCAHNLERRLTELPDQTRALRSVLGGLRSSERGENRWTKGTPPVPLNLAAHDHLEAVNAVLVSWVRMVCEERDLRGPDRNGTALLAGWLLSQLPWLLEHGAVGDLAEEVRELARVADGLTHTTRRPVRAGADCFACDGHLVRPVGSDGLEEDRVVCRGCGLEYDPAQYRLALTAAAEAAAQVEIDGDQWATPEWLALDLGRPVNTIKRWRRDGLVAVRHVGGLAFLRVEDVREHHTTRGTRRSA